MTNTKTTNTLTKGVVNMQELGTRWVLVRDRQAGLQAEARAERLARLARDGRDAVRTGNGRVRMDGYPAHGDAARSGIVAGNPASASAALLTAARVDVGRRLIQIGAALAAEPRLTDDCGCSEAA